MSTGTITPQKGEDFVVSYIDRNQVREDPQFSFTSSDEPANWVRLIYERVIALTSARATVEASVSPEPAAVSQSALGRETEEALKILSLRLARGEITKEEYQEMRELLT